MIPISRTPDNLADGMERVLRPSGDAATTLGCFIRSQHWISALQYLLAPTNFANDEHLRCRGKAFRLLCDYAALPSKETPLFVALAAGLHRAHAVTHAEEFRTSVLALINANHRLSKSSVNFLYRACVQHEIASGREVLDVAGYRPSTDTLHDLAREKKAAEKKALAAGARKAA